jgi:hypothetical protein
LFRAILITIILTAVDTVTLLIYSVAAVGAFVVIGWILCLIAIAKAGRTQKELRKIYGQESDIKKRIEQYISKKASDELGKAVEGYKEGLDLQSREVVKAMEEATKVHMDSLGKFILQQEALITKQAEYIIGAVVKTAQTDIETYKKNQMEGIDETVAGIVEKVAPDVIGKSISMEDHIELVWKSLERAKKEGLFIRGLVSSQGSEIRGVSSGPVSSTARGPVTTFPSASARIDKIDSKSDSKAMLRASGNLPSRATPSNQASRIGGKGGSRRVVEAIRDVKIVKSRTVKRKSKSHHRQGSGGQAKGKGKRGKSK